MGAPLAADSFAGERERNSLELLQLLPVKASTLFWGKLLAILPFPIVFAMLVQFAYWFSHPEISTTEALASVLGGLSAVLLTNAFSLLVSLKMKTVRAATHITLFFIVPLLLLVQMGYEYFLQGVFIPVLFLIGSVIVCVAASLLGMRKFVSL
jgi:ABC-type Na+ efflux pump permease subunit